MKRIEKILNKFTRKQWIIIIGMFLITLYLILSFRMGYSKKEGFTCGSEPIDIEIKK